MKSSTIRAGRLLTLALALVACTADRLIAPSATAQGGAAALAGSLPAIRISEFHYDNTGPDAGEKIEVSGPAGASFAGWKVVRYNGSNGQSYTTGGEPVYGGTFADQCNGRGTLVFSFAVNGLENGAPDGFALVDAANQVVEFLSYEGTFTAANGPAAGKTSTDVGAVEAGADPVGGSIQRDGNGIWKLTGTNTFGTCNDADVTPPAEVASVTVTPAPAQATVGGTATLTAKAFDGTGQPINGVTFTWTTNKPLIATVVDGVVTGVAAGTATITASAPNGKAGTSDVTVTVPVGPAANVRVSEFHYDNDGTDADEKIELEGDASGSLAGWSLVLYSGSTGSATAGQSYRTVALTGTFGNACTEGTRGVLTFDVAGLQNGDKDGFALVNAAGQVVEFLSYEGSFAAVNGPAAGMTSTDVGVDEEPAPASGRSLQRARNGTWFGPFTSTFGVCNVDTPPPPVTGISFTGRQPSDAPIPVGYEDQLFAKLLDENTGAEVATTFTWTSESPAIATIDARGVIRALAAGSATLRATAANGVTRTITLPTEVASFGDASLYRDPLAFGVPRNGLLVDGIRVTRSQYTLSFNSAKGTPNWVAYHLSTTVRGNLPGYRCDCFTPDPLVTPIGEPGISTADYTGSGYDRGHMVRSNDRELAHGDQATTYYTSNIVPQFANLNQGRWADFETYLQSVADGASHPEIYIFAGPRGVAKTFAEGRVTVPTATWKVAVVLPAGMTPADVHSRSDIVDLIAVDMPNVSDLPRDGNWQLHKTTVDAVEAASGYDLLSALPDPLEAILESGDREPVARITGAGLAGGSEGQALSFDAFTSSDPDLAGPLNDQLTYAWSVNGVAAGNGPALTHLFGDNGDFTVRLVVTDRFGASDEATATVTVTNVAPTVNAFPGATIIRGETYAAAGSFSDPGADTFTATVNYGDGTGTAPLATASTSFSLSHAYATAGSYTVTVTVTDDDGGSSTSTATVVVQSAADAIGVLSGKVNAFELAGILTKGEANALDASLKNALKSVQNGNAGAAASQLDAFINKVEAMQRSGRIGAAAATALTDYANRVIASMS